MSDHVSLNIRLQSKQSPWLEKLRVRRVTIQEALSRFYRVSIEALAPREDPGVGELVGSRATIVIERDDADPRILHGVITELVDRFSSHDEARVVELAIEPQAGALARHSAPRVFVDATLPEIVEKKLHAVLGETGTCEVALGEHHPRRPMVLQYGEDDHAFLARQLEHVGATWLFEQGSDAETIRVVDAIHRGPEADVLQIRHRARGEHRDIFALERREQIVPSMHVVAGYDLARPELRILHVEGKANGPCGATLEVDSGVTDADDARRIAIVRREEAQASATVWSGRSTCTSLTAGLHVTVTDRPGVDDLRLLVTEVTHEATVPVSESLAPAEPPHYENTFLAIPAERPFRPTRMTPRPRIAGLLPAMIEGIDATSGGAAAPLDEEGRYLVRFLFDVRTKREGAASCRVPLAQGFVATGGGIHFPLAAGVEVLVAFVDGDPDRPVIVGALPTQSKPSPVTLANPGVNRLRTASGITFDVVER